jgi:peptide chain release factor 1
MATIDELVEELDRSYHETHERLSDPAVYNDHREAATVGRRLKELEEPHRLAHEWRQTRADLDAARGDGELATLVPEYERDLARLEHELKLALAEKDPADVKDVIVEVRPGVGGDEAALWAADVQRMLARYAERRGFKVEQLTVSESEAGGVKESQGRIHTSTATVAVMPEAEEVEVEIDPNELKIDVYRSTGPGGQSVNTTDSAVRVTHLPTGIVVAMQDEKSQLQNRQKALRVLRARLLEAEREKQRRELEVTRRSQIGSGERAEKVRTYNFPENRVTDHRVKVTVHRLDSVLEGELDELTEALAAEERRHALETAATT